MRATAAFTIILAVCALLVGCKNLTPLTPEKAVNPCN